MCSKPALVAVELAADIETENKPDVVQNELLLVGGDDTKPTLILSEIVTSTSKSAEYLSTTVSAKRTLSKLKSQDSLDIPKYDEMHTFENKISTLNVGQLTQLVTSESTELNDFVVVSDAEAIALQHEEKHSQNNSLTNAPTIISTIEITNKLIASETTEQQHEEKHSLSQNKVLTNAPTIISMIKNTNLLIAPETELTHENTSDSSFISDAFDDFPLVKDLPG